MHETRRIFMAIYAKSVPSYNMGVLGRFFTFFLIVVRNIFLTTWN